MTTKSLLSTIVLLAIGLYAQCAIIYVKADASGSNNGTDWNNAFTSLQSGISASTPGDQIWVAAGTYKPTTTTNRNISFRLPTGVALYGGFNGTESQLTERDWTANETILSGDINTTGTASDNSYFVVTATNVAANTRFDGFKVIGAYAHILADDIWGGGIVVSNSSMTIANCTVTANSSYSGAGIAHTTGGGTTTGILNIINCNIHSNVSDGVSAIFLRGTQCNLIGCNISNNEGEQAIYINDGECNMDRCVVSGNLCNTTTGTIYVGQYNGSINAFNSLIVGNVCSSRSALSVYPFNDVTNTFWNCTVAGNKSTSTDPLFSCAISGGMLTSFRNCIVWGNQGDKQFYYTSSEDVQSCIVQGGYAGTGNTSIDPKFVTPGNAAQAPFNAATYNYTLQASSPGINTGSNTFTSTFYNLDLLDSARISALTVDRGCYEKQFCDAVVSITPNGPTSFCTGGFVSLSASTGTSYAWSNNTNSQNIAVSTSGNYTVTVIDNNGCFGTAAQQVTVYPASVQIAGNTTICTDGTTTLTASSPNGSIFNWSNGATSSSITVSQAGSYTVTVTTQNTCTATSQPANVTINNVATPLIIQNGNILTSSQPNGNQWYINGNIINGATGQDYTPTQTGAYTVVVTNNGCSSDASAPVAVTVTPTGISDIANSALNVYPNPTTNTFIVETQIPNAQYYLYDVNGSLMLQGKLVQAQQTIDISSLAAGVYSLHVMGNNAQGKMKVVKQ